MACDETDSDPTSDLQYDAHGFLILSDESCTRCRGCRSSGDEGEILVDQWKQYCNEESGSISSSEARKLIRKGVPTTLRGKVWKKMLHACEVKAKHSATFHYERKVEQLYQRLREMGLCEGDSKTPLPVLAKQVDNAVNSAKEMSPDDTELQRIMRQILMDIERTFTGHRIFTSDASRWSVFNALVAYAQFNPSIGYCQGMAYVAAILRMYIEDEEDVFWCLLSLLEGENHMHLFYERTLNKVKVYAELFRSLLRDHLPQLHTHLESLEIHPLMFFTQWLMGLYSGLSCWDSVLLICDLFFMEGSHQLLNAGLALMQLCMPEILAMGRIEQVLPFVQNIPSRLIHRKSLQSLLFGHSMLKSQAELASRLDSAQQRVFSEDQELQEVRENYVQRKTSRKRPRDDGDEADRVSTQPAGLLSKIASVFTPAKRTRVEPNQFLPTAAVTSSLSKAVLPRAVETPARAGYTFSRNPQTPHLTSTMPRSAVTSIRKGRARVFFTPDGGLVYTSPNTVEMGDLTDNPGSGRRRSQRVGRVMTQAGMNGRAASSTEVVKLTFDSPDKRNHQVKPTGKKAHATAKKQASDKSLDKVEEPDSATNKLFTPV